MRLPNSAVLAILLASTQVILPIEASARPFGLAHAERAPRHRYLLDWDKDGAVDVYVAPSSDAPVSKARKLADDNLRGRAELRVTKIARPIFLLKSESDGSLIRVAERVLSMQRSSNFRDIGGYPAADGRHVRWGKIFRSAAMPMLTKADQTFVSRLGISTIVDLRSREESSLAPTNWQAMGVTKYVAPSYDLSSIMNDSNNSDSGGLSDAYKRFPYFLIPQIREILSDLLKNESPLLYNCTAGQDRTGFVTALLLSVLGVSRAHIYDDYLLTTPSRHPENEVSMQALRSQTRSNPAIEFFRGMLTKDGQRASAPKLPVNAQGVPYLSFSFDEIDRRWGSVDLYLHSAIGLTDEDISKLKNLYLE